MARGGRGEFVDGARHSIALAIALLRADPIVIGRLWLEVVDAHPENRVSMAVVQPKGRFRGLAQVLGIRTVVHDAVMHVRTPRVGRCPSDNSQVIHGDLELWRFDDLDARILLEGREYLSGAVVRCDTAG